VLPDAAIVWLETRSSRDEHHALVRQRLDGGGELLLEYTWNRRARRTPAAEPALPPVAKQAGAQAVLELEIDGGTLVARAPVPVAALRELVAALR
jgi:hypothetical protein